MAEYTPFGLEVKTKLLKLPRTQKWLAEEVNRDTGLKIDGAYVSNILTGAKKSDRVTASIRKILDIAE